MIPNKTNGQLIQVELADAPQIPSGADDHDQPHSIRRVEFVFTVRRLSCGWRKVSYEQ